MGRVSTKENKTQYQIFREELGFSREGDILDIAANEGIIVKSGAWYAYKDEKIGQGRENAKQYLRDHPETF